MWWSCRYFQECIVLFYLVLVQHCVSGFLPHFVEQLWVRCYILWPDGSIYFKKEMCQILCSNYLLLQPKKIFLFEDSKQRAGQWKKAIESLQNPWVLSMISTNHCLFIARAICWYVNTTSSVEYSRWSCMLQKTSYRDRHRFDSSPKLTNESCHLQKSTIFDSFFYNLSTELVYRRTSFYVF